MLNGVEDEWLKFINGDIEPCIENDRENNLRSNRSSREIYNTNDNIDSNKDIDYFNNIDIDYFNNIDRVDNVKNYDVNIDTSYNNIPKCSDIYISTKTKISYFNKEVDLAYVFWLLPIIKYQEQNEGIIKKQMKFQSYSKDELENIIKKTSKYYYYKSDILCNIDNPNGKIKFKDTRKISLGLCKKILLILDVK